MSFLHVKLRLENIQSIMKNVVFISLFISTLCCCASYKEKNIENESSGGKTITAPIVEKHFYNKIGEKQDHTEFYIQQSIQDYFIKFCESEVTRKQLESALAKTNSPIKTLTLKIEIREGRWDSCEDYPVQSRIGKYAVILEIQ